MAKLTLKSLEERIAKLEEAQNTGPQWPPRKGVYLEKDEKELRMLTESVPDSDGDITVDLVYVDTCDDYVTAARDYISQKEWANANLVYIGSLEEFFSGELFTTTAKAD